MITIPYMKSRQFTVRTVRLVTLVCGLLLFSTLEQNPVPGTSRVAPVPVNMGKLPLSFEPNRGQANQVVRYLAHAPGGIFYFTPSEIVLSLRSSDKKPQTGKSIEDKTSSEASGSGVRSTVSVVRSHFIAANPNATISGGALLSGKVNYLLGDDPTQWHVDTPTYGDIHYSDLYTGIDLTYSGAGGFLKGTYTVAPNARPSAIRWQYESATRPAVSVDKEGGLQIQIPGTNGSEAANIVEHAPIAWQEVEGKRIEVSARYVVAEDASISFSIGSYNRALPLMIDPTLTYSTYLGGTGNDYLNAITVDEAGNVYVTGTTSSVDFPLRNPFETYEEVNGPDAAFITKMNSTGSDLIYSTYLGNYTGSTEGLAIAVDRSGNTYVTGSTTAFRFPLVNPYQGQRLGYMDAFVIKLGPSGSQAIYSTYLGGTGDGFDQGFGIAADADGNAYVTGHTDAADFPTVNPYQPNAAGGGDVFVTKFNPSGSALLYSTYLGGGLGDTARSIAIDAVGNAYLAGQTSSTDFPLVNPFQSANRGGDDAFVTKLAASGSTLAYSTYLGGSGLDSGRGLVVDLDHNVYVAGSTQSSNFPTANPYQPTFGGNQDAFVTKLAASGSTLAYSTYLGGSGRDYGYGIAIDSYNNAHVTGRTGSFDFPVMDPIQPGLAGNVYDAFVTRFNSSGAALVYSTYLGGFGPAYGDDNAMGIAVDTSDNAYIGGYTASLDFPTVNAFQPNKSGGSYDSFIAKISPGSGPITPTPTPCTLAFTDVPPNNTFYPSIRCLACRGIISGYSDGTFKPDNLVTRGQLAKIVSNAAGFQEDPGPQIFQDVAPDNTFYQWINRLARRGHMGGYTCGGPGEPCVNGDRAYFRPGANATRGQTAKIVSNAKGYIESPNQQTFEDVPPDYTFYEWIQRLASHGAMGGYPCGGPGEPCGMIGNRPYFRPGNNVTRGQSSKIVGNTFYPNCSTP